MKEPCLCGAPDCRRCFPGNFRNGRYRFVECKKCGEEFDPDDSAGDQICWDCVSKQYEEDDEDDTDQDE
mgnify:CR=1 FL=1